MSRIAHPRPLHGQPTRTRTRPWPEPVIVIRSCDRAASLRVAHRLRALGGRPCRRDALRYEFTSAANRDRAPAEARSLHGWTSVEPAS